MTVLAYSKWRFASLATFALACVAGLPASAQFVPMQNYSQQAPPVYAQPAPGAYAQNPGAQNPGAQYQGAQYQGAQSYQGAQYQAQHPMYAAPRVASAAVLPTPVEAINKVAPAPQAAQVIQPTYQAPVQQGYTQQNAMSYQAAPSGYTAPTGYAPSGCSSCQSTPATTSWEGYTGAPAAGCATGNCGTSAYPSSSCGTPACNVGCYTPAAPKRQWFVGVYGLYMERNQPYKRAVAVRVADTTAIGSSYYPDPATDMFLWSTDAEVDGQFGGEIRFGSTFGCANACGGGQPFAWEIGYWQLEEDSSQATMLETMPVSSTNNRRIYGRMNYAGLEYDADGAGTTYGYRPLNDYVDYQAPLDGMPASNDIRVIGVRERQRFEMKNIELNFWRFGYPIESAGLAGCGLGQGGTGGACGTGACGVGGACGTQSCRPPRRFFINGLAGVRYMKIDEDIQTAWQFTRVDAVGDPLSGQPTAYTGFPRGDQNVIFDEVEADNQLVGFQLGCSMNWLVGCKWNLFADTNFGIYGNQMDVCKAVYGGGVTRFAGSGGAAMVKSSDTDVAFVGEARFGAGYQVSCNCRLTAAYRIFGLSGVAIAADQSYDFTSATTAGYINNNSSLILQGLQTGVEWKY